MKGKYPDVEISEITGLSIEEINELWIKCSIQKLIINIFKNI